MILLAHGCLDGAKFESIMHRRPKLNRCCTLVWPNWIILTDFFHNVPGVCSNCEYCFHIWKVHILPPPPGSFNSSFCLSLFIFEPVSVVFVGLLARDFWHATSKCFILLTNISLIILLICFDPHLDLSNIRPWTCSCFTCWLFGYYSCLRKVLSESRWSFSW